jgi:hypothetical protein
LRAVGPIITFSPLKRGNMLFAGLSMGMFSKGTQLNIPHSWINSTLAGLKRVNPFIDKLDRLANISPDNESMALQIEHSDGTNEVAAVISYFACTCISTIPV